MAYWLCGVNIGYKQLPDPNLFDTFEVPIPLTTNDSYVGPFEKRVDTASISVNNGSFSLTNKLSRLKSDGEAVRGIDVAPETNLKDYRGLTIKRRLDSFLPTLQVMALYRCFRTRKNHIHGPWAGRRMIELMRLASRTT